MFFRGLSIFMSSRDMRYAWMQISSERLEVLVHCHNNISLFILMAKIVAIKSSQAFVILYSFEKYECSNAVER
jgi:hypothetical protein